MAEETYTNRRAEPFTIETLMTHGGRISVSTTGVLGFNVPLNDATKSMQAGETYLLELRAFNDVAGIHTADGRYLFRHSDQHFERQREQFRADFAKRKRDELDANRDDWQNRQDALPEWLQDRLGRYHTAGGEHFALEGWRYELIICELAAIYERNGRVDDDELNDFAFKHGTSGNQHDCALALVRNKNNAHLIPAGLTPLTGDPDYSKGNQQ